MAEQDILDVIAGHFHIDGPHDRDRAIDAARCAAALIRYLNHATLPGPRAGRTLEWANTVHEILGGLEAVANAQNQLFDQLRQGLLRLVDNDPTLYDDRRDDVHTASATAGHAASALMRAIESTDQLASDLGQARQHTVHLGNE